MYGKRNLLYLEFLKIFKNIFLSFWNANILYCRSETDYVFVARSYRKMKLNKVYRWFHTSLIVTHLALDKVLISFLLLRLWCEKSTRPHKGAHMPIKYIISVFIFFVAHGSKIKAAFCMGENRNLTPIINLKFNEENWLKITSKLFAFTLVKKLSCVRKHTFAFSCLVFQYICLSQATCLISSTAKEVPRRIARLFWSMKQSNWRDPILVFAVISTFCFFQRRIPVAIFKSSAKSSTSHLLTAFMKSTRTVRARSRPYATWHVMAVDGRYWLPVIPTNGPNKTYYGIMRWIQNWRMIIPFFLKQTILRTVETWKVLLLNTVWKQTALVSAMLNIFSTLYFLTNFCNYLISRKWQNHIFCEGTQKRFKVFSRR